MTIQDGVDLVGATAGLVHALGIDRDDLFSLCPKCIKSGQFLRGQARLQGVGRAGRSDGSRCAIHVVFGECRIQFFRICQMCKQPIEQRDVTIRDNL